MRTILERIDIRDPHDTDGVTTVTVERSPSTGEFVFRNGVEWSIRMLPREAERFVTRLYEGVMRELERDMLSVPPTD